MPEGSCIIRGILLIHQIVVAHDPSGYHNQNRQQDGRRSPFMPRCHIPQADPPRWVQEEMNKLIRFIFFLHRRLRLAVTANNMAQLMRGGISFLFSVQSIPEEKELYIAVRIQKGVLGKNRFSDP